MIAPAVCSACRIPWRWRGRGEPPALCGYCNAKRPRPLEHPPRRVLRSEAPALLEELRSTLRIAARALIDEEVASDAGISGEGSDDATPPSASRAAS